MLYYKAYFEGCKVFTQQEINPPRSQTSEHPDPGQTELFQDPTNRLRLLHPLQVPTCKAMWDHEIHGTFFNKTTPLLIRGRYLKHRYHNVHAFKQQPSPFLQQLVTKTRISLKNQPQNPTIT